MWRSTSVLFSDQSQTSDIPGISRWPEPWIGYWKNRFIPTMDLYPIPQSINENRKKNISRKQKEEYFFEHSLSRSVAFSMPLDGLSLQSCLPITAKVFSLSFTSFCFLIVQAWHVFYVLLFIFSFLTSPSPFFFPYFSPGSRLFLFGLLQNRPVAPGDMGNQHPSQNVLNCCGPTNNGNVLPVEVTSKKSPRQSLHGAPESLWILQFPVFKTLIFSAVPNLARP